MKKKTVGIIVAVLVLALVGCIGWHWRDLPQKRLLGQAEDIVFSDVDSADHLLAQVDTTRLREGSRMLYDLLRALVREERWHLCYADSVSCLSSVDSTILESTKEERPHPSATPVWNFKRTTVYQHVDDKSQVADTALMRVYYYYERASLGGTTDDKELLSRFGRICWAMSRNDELVTRLTADKLLHLAIHCAEASGDHALGYRACHLLGKKSKNVMQLLCFTNALKEYRLSSCRAPWLLTLLNDYGSAVLLTGPFDLHRFPSLERTAAIVARCGKESPTADVCDSVFQSLDSLWALPAPNFGYAFFSNFIDDAIHSCTSEIGVHAGMYEEKQQMWETGDSSHKYKMGFDTEWKNTVNTFNTSQDTYLAAGYVMKTASLQRRLMMAVIVILLLSLLLLALLFRNWRIKLRQRHEAERIAQQQEAEQLAERLRQKDSVITKLRGHILDKSEILDMLEPTAGKRTIINARNWQEIEMTLDNADNQFVSRLRATYPQFSEDDIRLCMLSRLKLSNTALSAIYAISVSAVQHRKQKLKKDGFGVTDPMVTFDQVIAEF